MKDNEVKSFGMTKQQVRLVDIFIICPFLFWASSKSASKTIKYGLFAIATSTLIYNGYNYIKANP
jgi:hypothetical protein